MTVVQGILLAVSGGPDSTALLLMAARWASQEGRPRIEVATVDHAMRAGSGEESDAVGALARRLEGRALVPWGLPGCHPATLIPRTSSYPTRTPTPRTQR